MPELAIRDALREAIREEMRANERVIVLGEDVGAYGGSYSVTKGLLDEFGPERIIDTPISEQGFVGAGIGAAMAGLRPCVEIMTINFARIRPDRQLRREDLLDVRRPGQRPDRHPHRQRRRPVARGAALP